MLPSPVAAFIASMQALDIDIIHLTLHAFADLAEAYHLENLISMDDRFQVHAQEYSTLTVVFGGVGGIIASTVYREKDFPRYLPGLWVTLGARFLLLFLVWAMTLHFTRLNRLSRAGKLAGPLKGQVGYSLIFPSADGPFLYNVVCPSVLLLPQGKAVFKVSV
ncbi:hypothetical protein B0H14DRAFT_3529093 [Mycena olivaceomarginata]|nr:hypothetical protein B0H14DRAFT_3529093 [Mycena olivaceomarginata]